MQKNCPGWLEFSSWDADPTEPMLQWYTQWCINAYCGTLGGITWDRPRDKSLLDVWGCRKEVSGAHLTFDRFLCSDNRWLWCLKPHKNCQVSPSMSSDEWCGQQGLNHMRTSTNTLTPRMELIMENLLNTWAWWCQPVRKPCCHRFWSPSNITGPSCSIMWLFLLCHKGHSSLSNSLEAGRTVLKAAFGNAAVGQQWLGWCQVWYVKSKALNVGTALISKANYSSHMWVSLS